MILNGILMLGGCEDTWMSKKERGKLNEQALIVIENRLVEKQKASNPTIDAFIIIFPVSFGTL